MHDHHRQLLRQTIGGRRVVVAVDVLVQGAELAAQLRQLGAADVLLIAGSRGTGALDPGVGREAVVLNVTGRDLMDGIRAVDAALADLPVDARRALERFDPDGCALVVTSLFSQLEAVAGRRVLGARPQAWRRLEDKTLVDAVWDAAGVARVPSAVVPATRTHLLAAAADLDRGLGTVWVADNRRGWHGGGQLLQWVRSEQDAEQAARFLARRADRARVMPFLDGLPCSVHGWAFDDHVAALRPCEMVVLRERGRAALHYAGAATTWEPPAADRAAMQTVARLVGAHLRATVGYRGVFTVDGVMTAEGFRPTELNPRFGAAIALMARATGLPLYLLHLASVERPDLDWRPAQLEARILAAADAHPVAAGSMVLAGHPVRDLATLRLVWRDGRAVAARPGEPPDVVLELGPGPAGGFLRVTLPSHPRAAPAAPAVARALAAARQHWQLPVPDLQAAPDPRGIPDAPHPPAGDAGSVL